MKSSKMSRYRSVAEIVSLGIAGLGGIVLLVLGGLFAFIVGTGGIYGNGTFRDATVATMLWAAVVLTVGALPLALISVFVVVRFRRKKYPTWLMAFGWIVVVGIAVTVFLDALSAIHGVGLGILTIPVLPYLTGLFGFLALSRKSGV
jgi:hypothetical protein